MRVVLCLLTVREAIQRLAHDRDLYFDQEEFLELADASPRTWAGRMALKDALVRLWHEGGVVARPADFRILRDEDGAPRVAGRAIEGAGAFGWPWVSISHSKHTACGIAVGPEVLP